jgi:hypothetical protein
MGCKELAFIRPLQALGSRRDLLVRTQRHSARAPAPRFTRFSKSSKFHNGVDTPGIVFLLIPLFSAQITKPSPNSNALLRLRIEH